ncbi:MAG: MBOAT family protein [Lachnospiraceae bacterium]|nr:MBOAT family protein [Lachnospiraceae bacterium]
MQFSDLTFIFRVLPVILLIYYIVPYKFRSPVLSVAGLIFYAINAGPDLIILLLSIIINYGLSFPVSAKKKPALIFSLVINASALIAFKLCAAFMKPVNIGDLLVIEFMLPLGMSFYIFKLISYQCDLYRGNIRRGSLTDLTLYVSLFTQIISGPISRFTYELDNPNRLIVSNESAKSRIKNAMGYIEEGLIYFITGLFFKVVIADHLAMIWREIGTIGYENLSTPLAWIGVFVYSMDLYYDFWGYSLMAAGIGMMFGFKFIRNFKNPYFASSVSDFYRRWHMTLGEWFKDYIYIPLGGSKKGSTRTVINLSIVWLLTGLWHGLSFNYILWAVSLLLIIIFEKFVLTGAGVFGRIMGRFNVLILIPLTWIIFALTSSSDLLHYFMRLINISAPISVINETDYVSLLREGWIYMLPALFFLIPSLKRVLNKNKYTIKVALIMLILFWISIYSIAGSASNPFMYMSF